MKKRRIFVCTCLAAAALSMAACSKDSKKDTKENAVEEQQKTEINVFNNLANEAEVNEIKTLLNDAKLSNVDSFLSWVADYNKAMPAEVGLVESFTPLKEQKYNLDSMSRAWDETHTELGDASSRVAAYFLLQNTIETKEKEEYGTIIMMDMDQFETDAMLEPIKADLYKFSNIFDEIDIKGIKTEEEFKQLYPNAWKDRGVSFTSDKASMISVVSDDPVDGVAFISHTGVAVKEADYVLFVEKIAQTEPYQVTRFENVEAIKEYLLTSRSYEVPDQKFNPIVLENSNVL